MKASHHAGTSQGELKTTVPSASEDPLLRSARREAVISLIAFAVAVTYTIGYCWRFGYQSPDAELQLVLGVPSWVMWGIFAPWAACTLFGIVFSFAVMTDHELEEPAAPPDAKGVTQEE